MIKKQQGFAHLGLILLIVLVAAAASFAGWKVISSKDNSSEKAKPATSSTSNNSQPATDAQPEADTSTKPSADTLENIKDSIKSGNTAALEGYMASSVNVILAASEAYGPQTPTQAISDLQYLDDATDPWDFALPAATIANYQAGDYKQYFPDGALVGKSANDYLVSFQFDSSGKINGIFMTIKADTL